MKIYRVNINFSLNQYIAPKNYVVLEFTQAYSINNVRVKGFIGSAFGLNKFQKNQYVQVLGASHSVFGYPKATRRGISLYVKGIESVSNPKVKTVSWRQFVYQLPTQSITLQPSVKRVRVPGGYNAPNNKNLNLNWSTSNPYTAPNGRISLNFGHLGYGHIYASVGFTESFGSHNVSKNLVINPNGFNAQSFGTNSLYRNNAFIYTVGFQQDIFGVPFFKKNMTYVYPPGFVDTRFSSSKVYNLKQMFKIDGFYATTFGQAFLWGGVKYVTQPGINSSVVPSPIVINTTANREIRLLGATHSAFGYLNVSPRIIYPNGVFGTGIGIANVRFPPRPDGIYAATYGTPWVSRSPRLYTTLGFNSFDSGYAKVFDPLQKIGVTGINTVISGGVFGDIYLRNSRRFINSIGFNAQESGNWSNVYSNRRVINPSGVELSLFGVNIIWNKTPSFTPMSVDHMMFGKHHISYAIRELLVPGFDLYRFGSVKLTKTPSLSPLGIDAATVSKPVVTDAIRHLYHEGSYSFKSGQHTLWFRYRSFKPNGLDALSFGIPKFEHSNRNLDIHGFNSEAYSPNAWVSYRLRQISVPTIQKTNYASNHKVGRHQKMWVDGFDASRFGLRIIPESTSVYQVNALPSTLFGVQNVELLKRYLKPVSFGANNGISGDAIGSLSIWNARQYVSQYYIVDSGLVPPKQDGWLLVENRNKVMSTSGNTHTRYGYTVIANKARQMLPVSFNSYVPSKPMIGERIRYLRLNGIENPFFSTWNKVHNDARVIRPNGVQSTRIGDVEHVFNNRRNFPYIGNLFSQEMGKPMIAFRIRHVIGDQRYGIAPPRINLHNVQLYTRYVEPLAHDFYSSGAASLTIKWNIITPRWTLRNDYGYPTVKNLTPELLTRGRNAEEFGDTQVRLQWRPVDPIGSDSSLFGRSKIADRTQGFTVSGTNMLNIGNKLNVVKTGAPPYSVQFIWLDKTTIDGEEKQSHGIGAPKDQVGRPGFNQNVLYTVSDKPSTAFGQIKIWSNNLMVQPGIGVLVDAVSEPNVRLNTRFVNAESIKSAGGVGNPRLSPCTIYAVVEAPKQARDNHPSQMLHLVNSMSILGSPVVTNRHRAIQVIWDWRGIYPGVGTPSTQLRKQVVQPNGFNMLRFGWHEIPSKFKDVEQYESSDTMAFGRPALHIPYYGPLKANPSGASTAAYGRPLVEFLNREVKPQGFHSLVMGNSRKSTYEYSPQSLHIGPPMPTKPNAFNTALYGKPFVSHRVRQVEPVSFDGFIATYTVSKFKQRMKVELAIKPNLILDQGVSVVGINSAGYSVPNIKLAVHYIRPDGNSDQHRKGVPE